MTLLPPGIPVFIKAPDEAAALAAADLLHAETLSSPRPVTLLDEEGAWLRRGPNHVLILDVAVPLTLASFDADGNELEPATYEPGWFANLKLRSGLWNVDQLSGLVAHLGVELKHPKSPAQGWQTGTEEVT